MLGQIKRLLIEKGLTEDESRRVDRAVPRLNSAGFDEWGLDPDTVKATLAASQWLYHDYFRVETAGIERIPQGRVLLIANHGGQIAFDGFIIGAAVLLESEPPRVVRGMVERWFPRIPFISTLFMRCGQMVGDERNCRDLLEDDQCVLVFPEGVRGSGKLYSERYRLQRFGTGFVRLALETKTPIVPVAVIGCEETYPAVHNLKAAAALLGAPYFPITPFFPLLGPLGALPLPTKVTIRFGEPLRFEEDADAPDAVIDRLVDEVRSRLEAEIRTGLEKRGANIFFNPAK